MADQQDDSAEKSHEPSQRKLEQARKKGEIPRAPDMLTGMSYLGMLLCGLVLGPQAMAGFGDAILPLIEQPDQLAEQFFKPGATAPAGRLIAAGLIPGAPLLVVPGVFVLATLLASRGIIFSGSKLAPKFSRLSPIENAKNKFGRRGLFEFAKSFSKLAIYSLCLAVFLATKIEEITGSVLAGPTASAIMMLTMMLDLLFIVVFIALTIGGIDYFWQRADHIRKNRMSQKELRDEHKEAEGDPMLKQKRRMRAQEIALSQMMGDVPDANVVIVNPTHYAVALKWDRASGKAPVCVAKGTDHVALRIREVATEAKVPIHSDPPTARALFATTNIGAEISEDHYRPVAAAIRFAEDMRTKMRERGW